ncbi:MAG: hypothetical protein WBA10_05750, partial [Elainellaceae cyanobacterium]
MAQRWFRWIASIPPLPIRLVLIGLFVVQIFSATGLSGYLYSLHAQQRTAATRQHIVRDKGDRLQDSVDHYLSGPQRMAMSLALATDMGLLNWDSEAGQHYVQQHTNLLPPHSAIAFSEESDSDRQAPNLTAIAEENGRLGWPTNSDAPALWATPEAILIAAPTTAPAGTVVIQVPWTALQATLTTVAPETTAWLADSHGISSLLWASSSQRSSDSRLSAADTVPVSDLPNLQPLFSSLTTPRTAAPPMVAQGDRYYLAVQPQLPPSSAWQLIVALSTPPAVQPIPMPLPIVVLLCLLGITSLLSGLVGILMARWITRPISMLTEATKTLLQGGNWARPTFRLRELDNLADALHRLSAQLQTSLVAWSESESR